MSHIVLIAVERHFNHVNPVAIAIFGSFEDFQQDCILLIGANAAIYIVITSEINCFTIFCKDCCRSVVLGVERSRERRFPCVLLLIPLGESVVVIALACLL